jgi:hypothetical protein
MEPTLMEILNTIAEAMERIQRLLEQMQARLTLLEVRYALLVEDNPMWDSHNIQDDRQDDLPGLP